MAFWASELINKRVSAEKLVLPFSEDRIEHGAYELGLGVEVYITSSPGADKKRMAAADLAIIPPGQFALIHTEEIVKIPSDAIGLLSIKAGIKLKGLVNISGFHVDPGYEGQLVFSVHNAGANPVRLEVGQPTFLLWFCELTEPTKDIYDGEHKGQSGISAKAVTHIDGEIIGPQKLLQRFSEFETLTNAKIKELEHSSKHQDKVIWGFLGVLAIGILLLALPHCSHRNPTQENASQPASTDP